MSVATTPARTLGHEHGLQPLGGRVRLLPYAKALWSRRALVLALPAAELRAQNRSSVLGQAWHLLNPLLLAGTYYMVFGLLLQTDRGVDNFVAFLTIGVLIFHFTSKSVVAGAKSVVGNEGLMRSIRFPRAVLPIAGVLGELVALGFSLLTILAVLLATGERPQLAWLLLFPVLVMQLLFNTGIALLAARATTHFRDIEQILPFALRLWLYFSGVFYSVERFASHPAVIAVARANPLNAVLTLARGALLEGSSMPMWAWTSAGIWTGVALAGGMVFFVRREHRYGEG